MTLYSQYFFGFLLGAGGFVLGYLVGRVDLICARLSSSAPALPTPKSFSFNTRQSVAAGTAPPTIDERKYVAPIKTDGLVKTDSIALGKTTAKEDDIQSSVSKLAQLKGK